MHAKQAKPEAAHKTSVATFSKSPVSDFGPSVGPSSSQLESSPVGTDFSQIPVTGTSPAAIQTKLQVDAPDSALEREADRIADQVMQMNSPASDSGQDSSNGNFTPQIQRKCSKCYEEEEKVQRKEARPTLPAITPTIKAQVQSLKGGGQPLSQSERAFFEPRFGRDFSHVRLHTDHQAADTARQLNARAFTFGNHVAFGAGEHSSHDSSSRHLLAHELAHTVQQSNTIHRKELTPEQVASADAQVTEGVTFVGNLKATMYAEPDKSSEVVSRFHFGERLRKIHQDSPLPPGWVRCTSIGFLGTRTGFIDKSELLDPPPQLIQQDPGMRLYKVKSGETFWGLVKSQYGIKGNESTADLNINHFINAIRSVNKEKSFIVEEDILDKIGNFSISGRDASDTLLKAGYRLWIPSYSAAAEMDVGSGTVTGEVARLKKKIAQKRRDFAAAAELSTEFIGDEFQKLVEEFGPQIIKGLIKFAIEAAAILGASTAIGALIGSLLGGAGAVPGAKIGFEIGLVILKYYGIYELVVGVIGIGGLLLTKLTQLVSLAWEANGDQEKLIEAGKALATALALLGQVILSGLLAYLTKKGVDKLKGTRFAEKVGESNIAKWVRERQSRKSLKEKSGELIDDVVDGFQLDFALEGGGRMPGRLFSVGKTDGGVKPPRTTKTTVDDLKPAKEAPQKPSKPGRTSTPEEATELSPSRTQAKTAPGKATVAAGGRRLTIDELEPRMVLDPKKHQVFRGSSSVEARVGIDVTPAKDGLIHPTKPTKSGAPGSKPQGLSLNIDPANKNVASRGAHRVEVVPEGLQIIRDGTTGHFVIAPTKAMSPTAYQSLLDKVQLTPFNE